MQSWKVKNLHKITKRCTPHFDPPFRQTIKRFENWFEYIHLKFYTWSIFESITLTRATTTTYAKTTATAVTTTVTWTTTTTSATTKGVFNNIQAYHVPNTLYNAPHGEPGPRRSFVVKTLTFTSSSKKNSRLAKKQIVRWKDKQNNIE